MLGTGGTIVGMRTAVMGLLIVSLAALGVFAYWQSLAIRQEREQIRQLNAKLDAMPKTASLDLQEKCATQAQKQFDELGWNKNPMADFANHYSARLNKCFIEVEYTDTRTVRGEIITSKNVSDAFEGKVYGNYTWSTEKGTKFWEVPPLECKVTLPSGEEKVCDSADEFDELVKQYMEQ